MVNEAIKVSPTGRLIEHQPEFQDLCFPVSSKSGSFNPTRSIVSSDFSAVERRLAQSIGLTKIFPGL